VIKEKLRFKVTVKAKRDKVETLTVKSYTEFGWLVGWVAMVWWRSQREVNSSDQRVKKLMSLEPNPITTLSEV